MKRTIKCTVSILLSMILILSLLAGCGIKKNANAELIYYIIGTTKNDSERILSRCKEIIKENVGVDINFQFLTQDNYDLVISSGDPYDLITAPDWLNYWSNVSKGAFMEITDEDLKEYAPYIWENGGDSLSSSKYKGKRYAISSIRNDAALNCVALRGDLMDKYGIEGYDSIEDLDKYLIAVAENEKDMIAYDIPGNSAYSLLAGFAYDWNWAPVGSLSFGEHIYYRLDDPEHKLFIAAEQPEMLEFTNLMKRWNEKGVFSKSVLSNKTKLLDSFKSGRSAFCTLDFSQCQGLYDEFSADNRKDWDVRFYPRNFEVYQKYGFNNSMVAISAFSEKKELALKVINEFYSNRELYNLINYGIEDEHFAIDEDGFITYNEASENMGYFNIGVYNGSYALNSKVNFPGCDEIKDKIESLTVYNPAVNCPKSDEGIREIVTALTEVYQTYTTPRCYGAFLGSAEDALKKEVNALKTAGIDKYISFRQVQLDEYLSSINQN